jgi:flavin-dependent dehydrogenase
MLARPCSGPFNARVQDIRYDVIVIGGGPAGSTAGAYLAMAGKKVLVLEKERFPRFHIGESLLPYNQSILRELGVVDALERAGFPRKFGAQFHLGTGKKAVKVRFRDGRFNKETQSYQVERSLFDEILLRNTEMKGAEIREETPVLHAENDEEEVRVSIVDPKGKTKMIRGQYLLDASGRENFTGNRDGLRESHPRLKKLAAFAHYQGVVTDAGERSNDIVIICVEHGWFWLIPIGADKMSVGCVVDSADYRAQGLDPEAFLQNAVEQCPEMQKRMAGAMCLIPVQVTSDYSYQNRSFIGPRLLRAGDAAGFVDPVFSSGVFLAMKSGKAAARTLIDVLNGRRAEADSFRRYEKSVLKSIEFYQEMVGHFYTRPFLEVLLEPRNGMFSLVDAVNAALAGQMADKWNLRWRLRLFYRVVRMQAKRAIVPRIDFK